jgi:hypothetical protein
VPRRVAGWRPIEGPRYRIAPLKVRIAGAMTTVSVFAPREERFQPTSGEWDLVAWQRRHKRAFLARVRPALSARLIVDRRAVILCWLEPLAAVDGFLLRQVGEPCAVQGLSETCTSSTVAAPCERIGSGSAPVARSSAAWAARESLNEPTWITQLPAMLAGGAAASARTASAPWARGGLGLGDALTRTTSGAPMPGTKFAAV